jgi:hypothetical protein
LLNHCAEAASKSDPEYTIAALCDLSKAFDVINHEISLNKLHRYGTRGTVSDWFKSYLSNRMQFVEIDGNVSSSLPIRCGGPQGSTLGTLLYLIYVNDIGKSCQCNILSFADDTTLYVSHSNIDELFAIANEQLNNLFTWFCANKLCLNESKTKYIVIRPSHMRPDLKELNITINGTQLDRIGNDCKEKSSKFLGIHIDENLTWKYRNNQINQSFVGSIFIKASEAYVAL